MSVRAIEAEVSIKSGVQTECTIGREVIVEVHEDVNLESLTATENGTYEPDTGIDGYDRVVVDVPPTIPEIEALTVTDDGVYQASGDTLELNEAHTLISAWKAGGNYINYREVSGLNHSDMCYLADEGLRNEVVTWFNRYR